MGKTKSLDIRGSKIIENFLQALSAFSGYYEYPFDGERLVYDQFDSLLDGSNNYQDAFKYVWRISFH